MWPEAHLSGADSWRIQHVYAYECILVQVQKIQKPMPAIKLALTGIRWYVKCGDQLRMWNTIQTSIHRFFTPKNSRQMEAAHKTRERVFRGASRRYSRCLSIELPWEIWNIGQDTLGLCPEQAEQHPPTLHPSGRQEPHSQGRHSCQVTRRKQSLQWNGNRPRPLPRRVFQGFLHIKMYSS